MVLPRKMVVLPRKMMVLPRKMVVLPRKNGGFTSKKKTPVTLPPLDLLKKPKKKKKSP